MTLWCLSRKQQWSCSEWWRSPITCWLKWRRQALESGNLLGCSFPWAFQQAVVRAWLECWDAGPKHFLVVVQLCPFWMKPRPGSRPRWRNRVCFVLFCWFSLFPRWRLHWKVKIAASEKLSEVKWVHPRNMFLWYWIFRCLQKKSICKIANSWTHQNLWLSNSETLPKLHLCEIRIFKAWHVHTLLKYRW